MFFYPLIGHNNLIHQPIGDVIKIVI